MDKVSKKKGKYDKNIIIQNNENTLGPTEALSLTVESKNKESLSCNGTRPFKELE